MVVEKNNPAVRAVDTKTGDQVYKSKLRDFASLAQFYADSFSKEAEITTSTATKKGKSADAAKQKAIFRLIVGLSERGLSPAEAAEELKKRAERLDESSAKAVDSEMVARLLNESATHLQAVQFLESNQNFDPNSRDDFKKWKEEKAVSQRQKDEATATLRQVHLAAENHRDQTRATEKIDDIRDQHGIPDREALEIQVENLSRRINVEAAKVISTALREEEWRKAGRQINLRDGSDIGCDGKKFVGLSADDARHGFGNLLYNGKYGAPSAQELPANPTRKYITYRVSEYKQPILQEREVEETYEVPRYVMKVRVGSTREKRMVKRKVQVGEETPKMKDVVEGGNNEETYSLSFRRTGVVYDGRFMESMITSLVPKQLAEEVSDLLKNNPQMADKLFDLILPQSMRTAESGLKFEPSEHIGGQLLPPKKE